MVVGRSTWNEVLQIVFKSHKTSLISGNDSAVSIDSEVEDV
jgi:hypothetical protein